MAQTSINVRMDEDLKRQAEISKSFRVVLTTAISRKLLKQ